MAESMRKTQPKRKSAFEDDDAFDDRDQISSFDDDSSGIDEGEIVDFDDDNSEDSESGSLFEKLEYTNNVEKDGNAEASVLLSSFRDRAKREAARMAAAIDNEFWFAVIFQSQAQKDAFLKALGLYLDGDKYVDGVSLAKAMKVDLPPAEPVQEKHRTHPRFAALAFPLPTPKTSLGE